MQGPDLSAILRELGPPATSSTAVFAKFLSNFPKLTEPIVGRMLGMMASTNTKLFFLYTSVSSCSIHQYSCSFLAAAQAAASGAPRDSEDMHSLGLMNRLLRGDDPLPGTPPLLTQLAATLNSMGSSDYANHGWRVDVFTSVLVEHVSYSNNTLEFVTLTH